MNPIDEFMGYVLGGMTPMFVAASFFFALIGVFLSLLIGTTKRNPDSPRTPVKFSWTFFWSDNAKRIYKSVATTLIVIFLSIRFAQNIVGQEASMVYALTVGLGIDKAVEALKNMRK